LILEEGVAMNADFKDLRKKLISYSLLLSLMLTGCSEEDNTKKAYAGDTFDYTSITYYEGGIIRGTLPSNAVDGYIKIVTFKQGDAIFTRLVAIEDHSNGVGGRGPHYRTTKYVDLETGTTLISYTNGDSSGKTTEYISYSIGENLEIISELDFMPYLYKEGKFQDVYEINEIIAFYHDIIEPTLENNDEFSIQKS